MATIVLRSAGTPLTNNQIDANFANLNNDKVDKVTTAAQTTVSTLTINSDMLVAAGSITSTSGAITFGNDNLSTTGSLTCATFTSTGIDDNAASNALTIDSSQNVGIGATLESWSSSHTALRVGGNAALWVDSAAGNATQYLSQNEYFDGASRRRISTAAVTEFRQSLGTFVWSTAPSGSAGSIASITEHMTLGLNGGLYLGGATGGNKGTGTINAQAVYDDNVLLTCYVFDQELEGSISNSKWDNKVPDRILDDGTDTDKVEVRTHSPMRKFKARIGSEYDPLDIDKYSQHWKDKKHLTSMPNEVTFKHSDMSSGEWIQRLIETVEIQAVHIEQLNKRLKLLETKKGRFKRRSK